MPRKGCVPDYENDKVYLMQRETDGVLKFGTSNDVHVRRSALGKHMVILAVTDGSYEKEREVCERFQQYALKPRYGKQYCEWFHPVPAIFEYAARYMRDPITIAKQMRLPSNKTLYVKREEIPFTVPRPHLPRPANPPRVPWALNQVASLLEQKRQREGKVITVAEVSKVTGVDYPTLSKMISRPSSGGANVAHNRALMAYFGCKWEELFMCDHKWQEQQRAESKKVGRMKTLLLWGLISEQNVKYLRWHMTAAHAAHPTPPTAIEEAVA